MIKGRPCKVVDCSKSKPGKHGSAKLNYTGIDLFTDNKLQDINPAHAMVDTPIVSRKEWQVLDIDDDGFLSLMNDDGDQKDDLKLGDDKVAADVQERFANDEELIVTILSAVNEERIVSVKQATN
eukprot:Awhi_evm1s9343